MWSVVVCQAVSFRPPEVSLGSSRAPSSVPWPRVVPLFLGCPWAPARRPAPASWPAICRPTASFVCVLIGPWRWDAPGEPPAPLPRPRARPASLPSALQQGRYAMYATICIRLLGTGSTPPQMGRRRAAPWVGASHVRREHGNKEQGPNPEAPLPDARRAGDS
ncbi:hypothetical protein BGZ61DRAFT_482867 [Ilyonectria robusta]|uniref:uncharacterized protein n=1 Tax=Ilyonectria robusta TaxID=1079257 RepID=UPI001E8E6637|nr:uncharacterized protein BGZ61DRAFT_482867 [Ilyonectria robusta]KAH8670507.1 hypothetical protein BGZ61DRAFT_482867 [Ilyonectria robusta]